MRINKNYERYKKFCRTKNDIKYHIVLDSYQDHLFHTYNKPSPNRRLRKLVNMAANRVFWPYQRYSDATLRK